MRIRRLILGLFIVALLLFGGIVSYGAAHQWPAFSRVQKDGGRGVSEYTAVFLANGQVYFGKVYGRTATTIDLRDVYYLAVNQNTIQPQQEATSNGQVSLIKLGDELHGPNDRMQITVPQVLFTESLKDDSKVVAAIAHYQSK